MQRPFMTKEVKSASLVLALLLFAPVLTGMAHPQQGNGKKRLQAYHLKKPITLDGRVDEEEWGGMAPGTDFIQQLPAEGEASTERTEVRIAFDDKNIYFGVICFDSEPGKILVTQNRRDGELNDTDSFQILLDTFGDGQNGFVFATTPLGIEYDGQVSRAGMSGSTLSSTRTGGSSARAARSPGGAQRGGSSTFNLNWDGVWEVRAQRTSRGWEAEFAIPFKSLRFSDSHKNPWGVNFMRNIRRKNEQSFWSPVSRAFDLFRVSLAGELHGVEPRHQRSLQVIPFAVAGVSQDFQQQKGTTDAVHDFGLDLKYTLTSSLTMDVTVNTDFAQVEVDEEQVNLTRFDLFFPEKRPFFLENSGTFDFGTPREVEVFFSRRIGIDRSGRLVPIVAGARLTGKVRDFSLGFLNMQTESVADEIPANNFTVFRARRELRNRSAIGGIAVGRFATGTLSGSDDRNLTLGADANIGLGENWTIFSYLAKSFTPYRRTGRDHAARALLQYNSDRLEWRGGYTEIGEDFNPEAGYLRRSGYRKPEWAIYLSPRPKWKGLRRLWPHITGEEFLDFEGDRQGAYHHFDFRVDLNNGGDFGLARNYSFERLDQPFNIFPGVQIQPGSYGFSEWALYFSTDPSTTLFLNGRLTRGDFYDGTIRGINVDGGFRRGSSLL
ncbi:MAG: carbohydrate binding family 9 domain-containing protein, partial [Acidobacteria bacterium]|nr:carbohydrate binding family 9 domain-containing protein [Acidobacteriota bacterium]